MSNTKQKLNSPPAIDWPVYWFAALEQAVESGDYAAAAKAQQELERLGVAVKYLPRDRQEAPRAQTS
jgi:hypothetical protein